ncbi:CIS tube protein [Desulfovibrio cuneatus]|uniref:CIS tube protein n=1 Tax=Desulfovibrio cuneatus TaxID=159728 RepID=UPI0004897250|nr:hypothetical protein [Desulfovibrio cuneatus]
MNTATAKMVIETYTDKTYRSKLKVYTVLFNPEGYTLDWGFSFKEESFVTGGSRTLMEGVNRSVFDMKFIIDGTGVGAAALGRSSVNVADEIWNFMETATALNRKGTRKPEPPFCRLVWGNLCAKCLVSKVKLDVTLLDRKGAPLRATLTTTFQTIYPEK